MKYTAPKTIIHALPPQPLETNGCSYNLVVLVYSRPFTYHLCTSSGLWRMLVIQDETRYVRMRPRAGSLLYP